MDASLKWCHQHLHFGTSMPSGGVHPIRAVAVTQRGRSLQGAATFDRPEAIAALFRDPTLYPLFAKPAAGKYSVSVISADSYDPGTDSLGLLGGDHRPVRYIAETMAEGAGYVLQHRLRPTHELEANFGPRLWSVLLLVFIRPDGPRIHRALAKIANSMNPADNYWRPGNMLGAIEISTGRITGVVRGTGAEMARDELHPDTRQPVIGFGIPDWSQLCNLTREAAAVFPGIRTQSWDVALTEHGPTFLEANFGGDLNLAQLAEGRGAFDDEYRTISASAPFAVRARFRQDAQLRTAPTVPANFHQSVYNRTST